MTSSQAAAPTRMHPDDVERITAGVEGWLGPFEGALLYRLAEDADPAGAIVEIGSWQGKSTIWLAAGARAGRGAAVVAIDPHVGTSLRAAGETTAPLLRRNLARAGVADHVEVIVATSEQAATHWNRPISLLWIDGDHEYESVRQDVALWERHLLPGAAIALHDTFVWPGPEARRPRASDRNASVHVVRPRRDDDGCAPLRRARCSRAAGAAGAARQTRRIRGAPAGLRSKHARVREAPRCSRPRLKAPPRHWPRRVKMTGSVRRISLTSHQSDQLFT